MDKDHPDYEWAQKVFRRDICPHPPGWCYVCMFSSPEADMRRAIECLHPLRVSEISWFECGHPLHPSRIDGIEDYVVEAL